MRRGAHVQAAVACGITSKGPWRSAKTPGINQALSLDYLKSEGFIHYMMVGSRFTILSETPCADPHAGCCGEGWLDTSPYPIRLIFFNNSLNLTIKLSLSTSDHSSLL